MVRPEVMELYTSTWKHIMAPNGGPNGLDLVNFADSIPKLRQTLTCSVCNELLPIEQPLAPPSCNHFVCKGCKGQPRSESNSCQRCQNWSVYSEDSSLTLLMQGYKKFCKYFLLTKECQRILEIKTEVDPLFDSSSLIDIVVEGALRDAKEIDEEAELASLHNGSTESVLVSKQRSLQGDYALGRKIKEENVSDGIKSKNESGSSQDRCHKKGILLADYISVSTQTAGLTIQKNVKDRGSSPVKSLQTISPIPNGKTRASTSASTSMRDITVPHTIKIANGFANLDGRTISLMNKNPTTTATIRSAATLSPPIATRKSQVPVAQKWSESSKVLEFSSASNLFPIQLPSASAVLNLPTEVLTSTTASSIKTAAKENPVPVVSLVGRPVPTSNPISTGIVGTVVRADEVNGPAKKLKVRLPKPKSRRGGCRCGNAAAQPGNLTCCGQRCPCYVENVGCYDCRCKGCRNPHLPGGKKLLQGINAVIDTKTNTTVALTSITGASLVSNVPISTGSVNLVGVNSEHQQPQTVQQIYSRIQPMDFLTDQGFASAIYPLGTVANFAGFSIPLPILSVSHPSTVSSLHTGQTEIPTIHNVHSLQELGIQNIKSDSLLEESQSTMDS